MTYNIVDIWKEYKIGIRLDKDYKAGEWVNIKAFKKHIKKDYKDPFADLTEYEKF